MLRRRNIVCALALLLFFWVPEARAGDALERYNARLQQISRSYKQQFGEIRSGQRRSGEQADIKAAERKVRQLASMRNSAIAEARRMYEQEQREQKQTSPAVPATVSSAQQERDLIAAQRRAMEEGQKAFWAKVALEEPEIAALWAARVRAVGEEQTVFWADVAANEKQFMKLWAARVNAVEEEQTAFWAQVFRTDGRVAPLSDPK